MVLVLGRAEEGPTVWSQACKTGPASVPEGGGVLAFEDERKVEFSHRGTEGTASKIGKPRVFGITEARRITGTLIPSAQRFVWAAKQPLGNAALGALFA